jgi:hypothetical protein
MLVNIPGKDNRFFQQNQGDLSGNVWASWRLDFDSNPGVVKVSPSLYLHASSLSSSLLVYPVAFCRSSADSYDRWWAVCNTILYKALTNDSGALGTFAFDPIADSPVTNYLYSDLAEWELTSDASLSLFCSTSSMVCKLTNGTWDTNWYTELTGNPVITPNVPHPLCIGFNNLFLIGHGNYVASVDNTGTVSNHRLTFENEYQVVWIRSSNSAIYVGCRNTRGRQAKVFVWDGYSENFNYDYKVGAGECLAGCIKDEICYTINNLGQLLAFNGGGFTEVARLPINGKTKRWLNSNNLQVHKNGMAIVDNKIHILLNASLGTSGSSAYYNELLENMLSGIWEYTPEHGLYHKYALNQNSSYGLPILRMTGALTDMSATGLSSSKYKFLAGCQFYTQDGQNVTTEVGAIERVQDDEYAKVGYLITPKIPTAEIEENWQRIYVLIKKLLNSTDKIKVKYRTDYVDYGATQIGLSGLWTTLNAFTCSNIDSSAVVGDEVEILGGIGAGLSANITSVNSSMVVIDEFYTGASGYNRFRVSNWKDVGTTINTQGLRNFELPIGDANSSWIQIKLVFFFTGEEELEKLIIKSTPQLKL